MPTFHRILFPTDFSEPSDRALQRGFFPSGAVYPIASFPPWLRAFARFDPETHAVAALKAILFRGGDVSAAGPHVAFLAVFAAAMLLLSTLRLKRTL
jgi:ABC-2 type transport system permease protein